MCLGVPLAVIVACVYENIAVASVKDAARFSETSVPSETARGRNSEEQTVTPRSTGTPIACDKSHPTVCPPSLGVAASFLSLRN
jgi:hypothetical protein